MSGGATRASGSGQGRAGAPRRLGLPVTAQVRAAVDGRPEAVDGDRVEAVRESWLVEDRWWTTTPVRRRYWEVVTEAGRDLVLFRDLESGTWAHQR